MRFWLLLALLPLLAACGELPGAGTEGEYQLLNAEELRMRITAWNGTPFQGTLRVLTREAPVVDGRVYLSLRGLVPTPTPTWTPTPGAQAPRSRWPGGTG
ncbi:hypothetical protein [Thermus scotoductus]|uniref:hypothetical protein n=1 Tax=Thermus scotoductus TaxID=37636 RepID=UPI0020A5C7E6|nr:hypothetical protein [Thermus scotoductus]